MLPITLGLAGIPLALAVEILMRSTERLQTRALLEITLPTSASGRTPDLRRSGQIWRPLGSLRTQSEFAGTSLPGATSETLRLNLEADVDQVCGGRLWPTKANFSPCWCMPGRLWQAGVWTPLSSYSHKQKRGNSLCPKVPCGEGYLFENLSHLAAPPSSGKHVAGMLHNVAQTRS